MKKVIKIRYLPVFGIACLLGLAIILTCTGQSGAEVGSPLSKVELSELYGGACETGCETVSSHCDGYERENCEPDDLGKYCARCQTDSNKEECKGWGFCVTWPVNTCSECVWDAGHNCGEKSSGGCLGYNCAITDEDDGECGSVTKCHTNNP